MTPTPARAALLERLLAEREQRRQEAGASAAAHSAPIANQREQRERRVQLVDRLLQERALERERAERERREEAMGASSGDGRVTAPPIAHAEALTPRPRTPAHADRQPRRGGSSSEPARAAAPAAVGRVSAERTVEAQMPRPSKPRAADPRLRPGWVERADRLSQEREEEFAKRDRLRLEAESDALAECTFTPRINRSGCSADGATSASSAAERLYQEGESRLLRARDRSESEGAHPPYPDPPPEPPPTPP